MITEYKNINYLEFKDLIKHDPVIIIPNSPIEVHGPHLPFGSDIIQSENMARTIAQEGEKISPEKAWIIFPTIPVGVDPLPMDGSINYKFHTLVDVLQTTAKNFLNAGIKNIIFTNFHGGARHIVAQDMAADYVNRNGGKSIAPFGMIFGEFLQDSFTEKILLLLQEKGFELELETDIHAGALETSLIMALEGNVHEIYQELELLSFKNESRQIVDTLDIFKNSLGLLSKDIEAFFGDLGLFFQAANHFKKNSYSGKPSDAHPEIGNILLEAIREKLEDIISSFLSESKIEGDKWKSVFWKNQRLMNDRIFDKVLDQMLGNKPLHRSFF